MRLRVAVTLAISRPRTAWRFGGRLHGLVRRRSLQIEALDVNQPVAQHVDSSLALFQHDVSEKWLVLPVVWLHLNENHLGKYGPESFDLDLYGATNRSLKQALIGRFPIDPSQFFHLTEAPTPRRRQNHVRCACVNQRIALDPFLWINGILDLYKCCNPSHFSHLYHALL